MKDEVFIEKVDNRIKAGDWNKLYICKNCSYKWKSKKSFGEPPYCPSCKALRITRFLGTPEWKEEINATRKYFEELSVNWRLERLEPYITHFIVEPFYKDDIDLITVDGSSFTVKENNLVKSIHDINRKNWGDVAIIVFGRRIGVEELTVAKKEKIKCIVCKGIKKDGWFSSLDEETKQWLEKNKSKITMLTFEDIRQKFEFST